VATGDGGFSCGRFPGDGEPGMAMPSPADGVWRRRAGGGAARQKEGIHRLGKRCRVEGLGGVRAEVRTVGERCRRGMVAREPATGGHGGGVAAAWMRRWMHGCTEEKMKQAEERVGYGRASGEVNVRSPGRKFDWKKFSTSYFLGVEILLGLAIGCRPYFGMGVSH
jgi:hypothetical protein